MKRIRSNQFNAELNLVAHPVGSYCFEEVAMIYFGQEEIVSLHYEEHREVWSVSEVVCPFRVGKMGVRPQSIR